MGSQFANYSQYVEEQATMFFNEYQHEAIQSIENGDSDIRGFIDDQRLHEWCDSDFIYVDLMDSAYIIDQSYNVEHDSGLWEGQEPQEAIKTQAFFTYRTDMYEAVSEKFKTILESKLEEFENELEQLHEEQDENDDYVMNEDKIAELEEKISLYEEAIDLI
jgi:hypothetical protein